MAACTASADGGSTTLESTEAKEPFKNGKILIRKQI
jgi:hypothetical protein